MKELRRRYNAFCLRNRNKGIPNLMLWLVILNAITYIVDLSDPSHLLYFTLVFDRTMILSHGQVWRLISWLAVDFIGSQSYIWLVIRVIFYLQISRTLESTWGTLRFNLFYLTGLLFMLLAGFIFDLWINIDSLCLSMFLAYATIYPDAVFLIFFIIPVKAQWMGIAYLAIELYELLQFRVFPYNLIPLFVLANYLLQLGPDVKNIFPVSWQLNAARLFGRKPARPSRGPAKVIPFPSDGTGTQKPYHHRCTVCGKTDVTHPDMDFRYCSRCSGYHCYCADHISNHAHVQE